MIRCCFLFMLAVTLLGQPVFAQEEGGAPPSGGGGPSGAMGSGLPSDINGPRTIPQQFASKLKLDKVQGPAVDQFLTTAAAEAAPHAAEMLQARQRLLNALRTDRADEVKAAQDAYAAAAAQVARIEAAAFAKVYAILKPNQQKEAPQAFALIAGLFSNPPTAGGAGREGSRGRGGRQ